MAGVWSNQLVRVRWGPIHLGRGIGAPQPRSASIGSEYEYSAWDMTVLAVCGVAYGDSGVTDGVSGKDIGISGVAEAGAAAFVFAN